jgi:UDP-N-acetylglucosamine:LPS N-acetylglucosamine transferase
VPESELDLARQAGELLSDSVRLAAMRTAMERLARPDAARAVADGLLALAGAR